jgi:hypothetical protein
MPTHQGVVTVRRVPKPRSQSRSFLPTWSTARRWGASWIVPSTWCCCVRLRVTARPRCWRTG